MGLGQLDVLSLKTGLYSPVFGGAVTGLVLGDLKTGLIVGATLQLATLGVATYGGATVPDFLSGSVMGTAYAIISGRGACLWYWVSYSNRPSFNTDGYSSTVGKHIFSKSCY